MKRFNVNGSIERMKLYLGFCVTAMSAVLLRVMRSCGERLNIPFDPIPSPDFEYYVMVINTQDDPYILKAEFFDLISECRDHVWMCRAERGVKFVSTYIPHDV